MLWVNFVGNIVMCFSDQIGMDRTNEKVEKASEYDLANG